MNKFDIYYKKCLAFMPYPPKMKEAILKEINDYVKNHDDLFERDFSTMHEFPIKVNLEGLPNNYPKNVDLKYIDIIIKFIPKDMAKLQDLHGFIELKDPPYYIQVNVYYDENGIIDITNEEEVVASYTETIEHELTHFVSSILTKSKEYKIDKSLEPDIYKGFPKEFDEEKFNKKFHHISKDENIKYNLDPIEFWTQIRDISNQLKNEKITLNKFKDIVGLNDLKYAWHPFRHYKIAFPKMWQRAVKELYKLMSNNII